MLRWPIDYVRLDDGALWIRPDLADRFARIGWNSLSNVLTSDRVNYVRLRTYFNGWDTGTAVIPGAGTGTLVHVKRFRPGWRGCSRGLAEANIVGLFESHGIDCLRIAAVGQSNWDRRISGYCSLFMSEQVGTGESAWSLLERTADGACPIDASGRRRIITSIAGVIARMHAAGLYHGDLKWKHLLPDPGPEQPDTWRLIDLERAGRRTGPSALKAWVTDLWRVRRSIEQLELSPDESELWFESYDESYRRLRGPFQRFLPYRDRAIDLRARVIKLRRPLLRLIHPAGRRTMRLPDPMSRAGS